MANSVLHAQLPPVYGMLWTVYVGFRAADGTSLAPTTLDTEVSKDGGTFADATNEVTLIKEVGGATDSALGYITFTAAEMTCDQLSIQIKSANCVTLEETITPQRLVAIGGGTAQAGAAATITLAAADATTFSGYWPACFLGITSGTGAGQIRQIASYVVATNIATITPNWETTPDNTSVYSIYANEVAVRVRSISGKVLGGAPSAQAIVGTGVWALDDAGAAVAAEATLLRTLGLSQENQYIDQVVLDTNNPKRMTSARLRIYSVAGSVGTDNDVLATYTITATYTGTDTAPTTYSVVKA